MYKNVLIGVGLILLLGLVYGLSYLNTSLNQVREDKDSLLEKFEATDKEITELKLTIEVKEQELAKLKEELSTLSYPQRLKKALSSAQDMINGLNMELAQTKEKWSSLRDENFSLKARLQNNTREINRLLDELQTARVKIKEVASAKQTVTQPDARGDFSEELREKDKRIKVLMQDFEEVNRKYMNLLKEKDTLERRSFEKLQRELARRPSDSLQRRIEELDRSLQEKEKERLNAELKLTQLVRQRDSLSAKLDKYNERIQELTLLNSNLQNQLLKFTSDLRQKDQDIQKLKDQLLADKGKPKDEAEIFELQEKLNIQRERLGMVTTLYNRLKAQLKEFSEILSIKDSQLEKKDKQIEGLKEEASYLKIKSESLEEAFEESQKNQRAIMQRLSQMTNINTSLQDRLTEVSFLIKKEALGEQIDPSQSYQRAEAVPGLPEDILGEKEPAYEFKDNLGNILGSIQNEKESTEDIKRRVEVILQSVESDDFFEEDFGESY